MIQLLIALAIVALLAVTLLGGEKKPQQQRAGIYQQQVDKVRGLEQSMQQAADQRMQEMERQTSGE